MPRVAVSKTPAQPDATELIPPERTTPALLMSLALHVLLLTSLGLIIVRRKELAAIFTGLKATLFPARS